MSLEHYVIVRLDNRDGRLSDSFGWTRGDVPLHRGTTVKVVLAERFDAVHWPSTLLASGNFCVKRLNPNRSVVSVHSPSPIYPATYEQAVHQACTIRNLSRGGFDGHVDWFGTADVDLYELARLSLYQRRRDRNRSVSPTPQSEPHQSCGRVLANLRQVAMPSRHVDQRRRRQSLSRMTRVERCGTKRRTSVRQRASDSDAAGRHEMMVPKRHKTSNTTSSSPMEQQKRLPAFT